MSWPLRGSRSRIFTSTRPPVGLRPSITWHESHKETKRSMRSWYLAFLHIREGKVISYCGGGFCCRILNHMTSVSSCSRGSTNIKTSSSRLFRGAAHLYDLSNFTLWFQFLHLHVGRPDRLVAPQETAVRWHGENSVTMATQKDTQPHLSYFDILFYESRAGYFYLLLFYS